MKKILVKIFTLGLCLTASTVVLAQSQEVQQQNDAPVTKEHSFNVGLEASHISYREPSLGVKEDGTMGGLYGIYNYRPQVNGLAPINVFHIDGHGNYGRMTYKGSGKIKNIDDYMVEPRAWVGRDFAVTPSVSVTPYAGIGYRALFDNLGGKTSSTGALGYDRLSQYLYAPVGFELATHAVTGWQFGFNAEYDIFIRGWQKSYLSSIQGFPDITNTQKKGYGLRGSFDLVKIMDHLDITASPYIRYWNIKQSDTATATGSLFQVTGYEPANHSTEIGLKLGAKF